MESRKIYKIRQKSTGLYSSGGEFPSFNKNGKTWNQLGHLKAHITNIKSRIKYLEHHYKHMVNMPKYKFPYNSIEHEVVEFQIEIRESETKILDLIFNNDSK
jgi:hypothetical protein